MYEHYHCSSRSFNNRGCFSSYFILKLFLCFCFSAFSQASIAAESGFRELVARLPANAKYAISPPSLRGSSVALYADPQNNKAYYIAPMLLPDWDALRASIEKNCGPKASTTAVHEVTMRLDFGRDQIRAQIAAIATELEKIPVSKDQIFSFPYAWLSVQTGAKAQASSRQQKFPVRTIAEYPTDAKRTIEARALRITPPEDFLAHISANCEELRSIYNNRDITGTFFAPTKDTQINAFSVEYRNFARSKLLSSLSTNESAVGAQTVISNTSGKGAGFNLGGHIGGSVRDSESRQQLIDSRARYVSANLLADAARRFAETISIRNWIEFQGDAVNKDRVAEELLKFVMRNSPEISLEIKRVDDMHWKLGNGVLERTLTNQQLKQVAESTSKLDIDFSEKATIGCPEQADGKNANPYCGSVDKKFKGVDDNGIKWQQDGAQWIPTSVTLYAVSSDKLDQASDASIVDVLVKDGGMVIADLQPVAVDIVPGSDLKNIIDAEVASLKKQINTLLDTIQNFQQGDMPGYDMSANVGTKFPGSKVNCLSGYFVSGLETYVEKGDGHLKTLLKCWRLPPLTLP